MTDTPARAARLIARAAPSGALATTRVGKGGGAYVSKVGLTLDIDGTPLFLLSTLAAHTQDLLADPRAAVLVEAPVITQNPLEAARATLTGRMVRLSRDDDAHARARYLIHHPGAKRYAGFGDFALWFLAVDKVHYVGGFGVAKWAKGGDYLHLGPDLARAEADILATLGGAHKDHLSAVFTQATGRSARSWRALAIDADGLCLIGPKGAQARLDFASPAPDGRGWRQRFARLAKRAM